MKRTDANVHEKLLQNLSHMPKKIMSLEGNEKTPEFVLHELCNEHNFNISKAAFFVDSPDFNFLRGVAGFYKQEAFPSQDIWDKAEDFMDHMQRSTFNQKVRELSRGSVAHGQIKDEELKAIAHQLGFENPYFHSWEMKYDNHGFLIYEYNGSSVPGIQDHLENSLYLFGFCPLF